MQIMHNLLDPSCANVIDSLRNHSLGFYLDVPTAGLSKPISYFIPTPISNLHFDRQDHGDSVDVQSARTLRDSGLWWIPGSMRVANASDEQLGIVDGDNLSNAFNALNPSIISLAQISRANGCLLGKREPSPLRQGIHWVGGSLEQNRLVVPPTSSLSSLMDDYCTFLVRSDVPSSIKQMFAFVQLVIIHPFHDANGRTARLLAAQVRARSDGDVDAGILMIMLLGLQREHHFHVHEALRFKQMSFGEYHGDWRRLDKWATLKAAEVAALEADRVKEFQEIFGGYSEGTRRLYLFLRRRPISKLSDLATSIPGSEKTRLKYIETLGKANWIQNENDSVRALRFLNDRRLLINELALDLPQLSVTA